MKHFSNQSIKKTNGFTIIELLVVVIIVGILATLVATTYGGVQAKNRNSDREASLDKLQAQLETYYAQYSKYPTLANINDASWRKTNMKDLSAGTLQDPRWDKDTAHCTTNGVAVLSSSPASNCFAYQVTTSEGAVCDNVKVACAQYTLTAQLEGGDKYVKSSLN
ncbi:MAG TPA: type II secretion system protein [Candidatus Saccharimonadales bacterium]|nr:type II secretion system protein [Candidatus Saccharimonadales bacterium]